MNQKTLTRTQNFTFSGNVRKHHESNNKYDEEKNQDCNHRKPHSSIGSCRSPEPLLLNPNTTSNPNSNMITGAIGAMQIVRPYSHPKPLRSRLPLLSHTITHTQHCFSLYTFSLYTFSL